MKQKIALAIHGGAGTILKSKMPARKEKEYRAGLEESLQKGHEILRNGGTALDAVEAAVNVLEDHPLYNAGRGSVFTTEGKIEMDAAVMFGKDLTAGAVAGVTNLKNPVSAARAVLEKSEHVLLAGSGAEAFAELWGLEKALPEYFFSEERWNALQKAKKEDPDKSQLDHNSGAPKKPKRKKDEKYGTVGAVALDAEGNLAAATSTGGLTNKKWGRIGDSPVIGAGTFANEFCAVSCTGSGEFFLRICAAKTLADLLEYKGYSLTRAGNEVIQKKLAAIGGDGGLIAVDKEGRIAMPFNTEGMYRGAIGKNGKVEIKIYRD